MEWEVAGIEKFLYEAGQEPEDYGLTDDELNRWEDEVAEIRRWMGGLKNIVDGVSDGGLINYSEVQSSNQLGDDGEYEETRGLTSQ